MMQHQTSARISVFIALTLLTGTLTACDPADASSEDFGADRVTYRDDQTAAIEALEARVLELERLHYTNRAFVTSSKYSASLGGVEGANSICQTHADDAGLGGTWVAWLSDSSGSPADNFTHSLYNYTLVDGTVIASNWDELTDGALDSLIGLDENGDTRTGYVWTGTTTAGEAVSNTCSDWTSTSYTGKVGSANDDSNGTKPQWWTTRGNLSCGSTARLYCFEQ